MFLFYFFIAIILIFLVAMSAVFSFSEMAIASSNKNKLKTIEKDLNSNLREKKRAKRVIVFIENYNEHISAIVIFNNIMNILFSTLSTVYFTVVFENIQGNSVNFIGPLISFLLMTPIVIIFGEIIPKQLAKKYPEKGVMKISWTLYIVNIIMKPITFILSKLIKEENKILLGSDEEIYMAISDATNAGVTTTFEAKLITNLLKLDNKKIRDLMIFKNEVVEIPKNTNENDLIEILKNNKHSRFPVIENNKIISIFSSKQYLYDKFFERSKELKKYMYDFLKFEDDENPFIVFEALRNRMEKMAIIIDNNEEYLGIVTLEDIVEYVLGEIYDEDDVSKDGIYTLNESSFSVFSDVKASYFFKKYLPDFKIDNINENESILNWVSKIAKKQIEIGDYYTYKNIIIWVKETNVNKNKIIFEIDII